MKTWIAVACAALALLAAFALWRMRAADRPAASAPAPERSVAHAAVAPSHRALSAAPSAAGQGRSSEGAPPAAEEGSGDAAERCVEEFDALTDAWTEPSANGVTVKDVERFRTKFAAVPKDRREECLQRALNLVPDENVMLLAGVLFDKAQDPALVELVFNDILNRDESVKQPLLREICRDKTHPCRADAAWVLDLTEEAPEADAAARP